MKKIKEKSRQLKSRYIAFGLLILIILTGILGFMKIENYSLIEAIFMTIITMSTVGYGEVRTLSNEGMIFSSALIILSFGIFAYVITTVTKYILDGEFRKYYKLRKVNKTIKKLSEHVIVCGYGRNGKQAVIELLAHNEDVIVIEKNEARMDEIEKKPQFVYIIGDATQDKVLEKARVVDAKALITTCPSDAENLFIVLTARAMSSKMTIISRASDTNSDVKLKLAGATNVMMPDKVGGTRMAKLVAQPDIVEFIEYLLIRSEKGVNLVEFSCKEINNYLINKTVGELNIRHATGANLIGMKTENQGYIFNPSPEIRLEKNYKLFAIGTPKEINNLKNLLKGKTINQ